LIRYKRIVSLFYPNNDAMQTSKVVLCPKAGTAKDAKPKVVDDVAQIPAGLHDDELLPLLEGVKDVRVWTLDFSGVGTHWDAYAGFACHSETWLLFVFVVWRSCFPSLVKLCSRLATSALGCPPFLSPYLFSPVFLT
jgi:hypothetical protein